MSGALTGRSALITGGGGGFGLAIGHRLAADGAAVTLFGRTESTLRDAAQEIAVSAPDAPRARYVVGSAQSDSDVKAAVEVADADNLRIAVCTVGGGTMAPLLGLESETLEHDFRRNVITALTAIRYSAATMAQNGGGSIVCISSTAGGLSFPFMGSYSVAKAGLEALVGVAADELGRHSVRVNAVRPGTVPTHAEKPGILVSDPQQREAVLREKPLARVGKAEDIADAVRFLAGPESNWVTGATVPVEGGNHLRRAPDLEMLARSVCGNTVVDDALEGRIPEVDQ